ncbi:MAG TPA: peptidoglycan bridge formation glycyltransferase FemA/FemB family protein [Candidatus Acidoferrales bacterium]|nr:peptidoglycan bridge formation glycyltransferase FemA/FemB family protein [Candidatus Acidoferrales bacterium]
MKLTASCSYQKIEQMKLGKGTAVALISRELEDAHWDKFLQETPLGQFQQSAIWARAKDAEGWHPVRVLMTMDEEIVGGFQLLWRSSWRGRIGYVSKGPVAPPGYPGLTEFATDLLQQLTQSEKLRGLVVQPPDLCGQMPASLAKSGFELNMLVGVNEATWIVDLGGWL